MAGQEFDPLEQYPFRIRHRCGSEVPLEKSVGDFLIGSLQLQEIGV
jgi:hypothetical protein